MQTLQTTKTLSKPLKVLIGDNSLAMGVLCSQSLTKSGVEVTLTTKDGQKVLDAIKSVNPDVVVMESFMAQLDAISVMQELSKSVSPMPKVIVLSGYDNPMIEHQLMDSGASYYMLKPFDIAALCQRVLSFGGILLESPLSRLANENEPDLETLVTDVILHIGVPAHVKGYHYIRFGIMLCVDDKGMINNVTKELYPTIAAEFDTTSSRVERAIRHAIEIAWDRGDIDVLNSYFGYTISTGRGKPTNSEFIAMISDKLRLQLKNKSYTSK